MIDRATNNVYFLNLVDESDLFALIEEVPVEKTVEIAIPLIQEIEPQEEILVVEKNINYTSILGLTGILVTSGIFYCIKFFKSKNTTKGTSILDEYEFEDDDDEIIDLENIEFVDDEV